MAMASCPSEATAPHYPEQLMGDVLQVQAVAAAAPDEVSIWSGELDEQLIKNGLLIDDDSLLGALVPADDYSRGNARVPAAAPCNTVPEHEQLPPPRAASMAPCSVYSGPTIRDIQKALSSRPYPSMASRLYGSLYLYGARSTTRGSKHTTTVRSCGGKMPTDGYKWRKYGQKFIKTKPHPRSYYKCTSSLCSAKKQVDKSTDDPEVFTVTYEGLHHHGPQPLSLQALAPKESYLMISGEAKKKAAWPSPMYNGAAGVGLPSKETCSDDDVPVQGGNNNRLQGRQKAVHRGNTDTSVPYPADAVITSFSSDSQTAANWCCLDFPSSFPEAHFQWTI